jgi:sugar/nucleoside kinase (ribokinase family)
VAATLSNTGRNRVGGKGTACVDKGRIFVVGDLNVDYLVSGDRLQSGILVGQSEPIPGGNGANAACAFRREGFTSVLIGTVGEDPHARILRDALGAEGVDALLAVDESRPTGVCHIVYAREDRYECKLKLMNRNHANRYEPGVIDRAFRDRGLGASDLLFATTDMLVREGVEVFRQILCIIEQYRPKLIVDLVPHDINKKIGLRDLAAVLSGRVRVLIAEFTTLLEQGETSPARSAPTEEDWRRLFARFDPEILVLRYGCDNVALQAIRRRSQEVDSGVVLSPEADTGYQDLGSPAEKRGYGDTLTARLVRKLLPMLHESD